MKNTLALTALAIAIAAPSTALATDVKFGGVVQTRLSLIDDGFNDPEDPTVDSSVTESDTAVTAGDVRLTASASETVGDLTGFVELQLNYDGLAGDTTFETDKAVAGISGDFGTFKLGKVDDTNQGRYANDILGEGVGGSGSALGYTNSFGAVNFGAFYAPEGSGDKIGLGASGSFGPVSVGASIGQSGDTDQVMIGAEAGLGAVTLGAHFFTEETGAAEKEIAAVKASGAAGAVSWGLTYAVESDVRTGLRLDLGTSVAGLDVGFRYNSETRDVAQDDGNDTKNTAYIQLGKGF